MADQWPECVSRVKGVILDMCGVLYDSGEGGGVPIEGSVEAVRRCFFFFCIKYITYCLQNKTFRLNSVEQRLSYKSLCTSCTSALCRVYNVKEYTPYLVHCMTK